MGRQKVTVTDLEKAIINQIRRHMDERSWSENRLSIEANMVSSTVHRMLSGKQNLTLSYLEQVCSAFGMRVSEIVRNSEQTIIGTAVLGEAVLSVPSAPSAVSVDPARAYIEETQAKLARVLQSNYTPAAKPHQPDPDANIGEENQDTGVQND